MVTDTISDLIIQLKNAGMVSKDAIEFPYSKIRYSVVQKLRVQNYVDNVETEGHGVNRKIIVRLAYDKNGKHKVKDVKRISKPSCRVYFGTKEIRPIKNGTGIMIMSTPKGILTGSEARKEHVGGEVLFNIW